VDEIGGRWCNPSQYVDDAAEVPRLCGQLVDRVAAISAAAAV